MSYYRDNVFETSTTQGTGPLTLAGAVAGARGIASAYADGAKIGYVIRSADEDGQFETGIGTFTAPDQLARNTVIESSNANAAVDWGPGTRNVFVAPAGRLLLHLLAPAGSGDARKPLVVGTNGQGVALGDDGWCGVAGGGADALTLMPQPPLPAYAAGQTFRFLAAGTNTGPATVAISGLAPAGLQRGGAALAPADIVAGRVYETTFDGAAFQLAPVSLTAAEWLAYLGLSAAATYAAASQAEAEAGAAADKLMTPQRTKQAIAARATTTGQIGYFPRDAAPTGWLKANGATLSRTTYAALWAEAQASGNLAASEGVKQAGQYGPGDGATTFSIPDLRGEFLRGWDDGRGVDAGRGLGSAQADAFKSHNHRYGAVYGYGYGNTGYSTIQTGSTYDTSSVGATETRPRNVALLACIKY